MYLKITDVEQTKQFHHDILMTEYFPKTQLTSTGVALPAMYSVAHGGYIPCFIFQSLLTSYNDLQNSWFNESNKDPLLTLNEYEAQVNELINGLNNIYAGQFTFKSKEINDMYLHYQKIHKSGMWVAGVCNMVADELLASCQDIDPIIPAEGYSTVLGFNTYSKSVSELVPNLNLDLYTALYLYKNYREEIGNPSNGDGEEIPFILDRNLSKVSDIVSDLTGNIPSQTINDILSETISDEILIGYYQYMLQNYGVREKVAKSLLLYSNFRLEKTIYNIVQQTANINTQRTLVLFGKVTVNNAPVARTLKLL